MIHSNFDKTAKGREEIATRKHQLPSRLRALLLLFDGKRTTDEVLQKVSGIGLNAQNIAELLHGGFIRHGDHPELSAPAPQPAHMVPSKPSGKPDDASIDKEKVPDGETVLQALYNFYTETIRTAIGLRGYALQLKVERARSVDDFRNMRQDYLAAVEKAQGAEAASHLDCRLQRLLQLEQAMVSKEA